MLDIFGDDMSKGYVTLISTRQIYYDVSGNAIESISPNGLRTGTIYYPDGQVQFTGILSSSAPDGGHAISSNGVTTQAFTTADFATVTVNGASENTYAQNIYNQYDSALGLFYSTSVDQLGHATKTYTDAEGRMVRTVYDDGSFTETLYSVGNTPVTVDQEGESVAVPTIDGNEIDISGYEEVQIAQRKSGDAPVITMDLYNADKELTNVWQPPVKDMDPSSPTYYPTYDQLVAPHTQYGYDTAGNEITQTDAKGNVTSFGYDQNGNQVSQQLPDGEVETWTYNVHGQVATHTDFDGNTATYSYIASGTKAGLLQQVVYTPGAGAASGTTQQTVNYTYNSLNQQQTVTDASGTTTSSYDAFGNLIESQTPEGTIYYTFDPATQNHVETSTANTDIVYGYDDQGRLTTVTVNKLNGTTLSTPLVTTYTYDAAGNKKTETLPDGEVTTWNYDSLNCLTSMTEVQGSTTLFSESYGLDDDGTRASAVETQLQPDGSAITLNYSWGYNADNQLTAESLSATGNTTASSTAAAAEDYSDSYTFDLVGNQITDTHAGAGGTVGTTTNTYNEDNQLKTSTINGVETDYDYDANGSQIDIKVSGTVMSAYIYDVRNKMVDYSGSSASASYLYDDDGNRVAETTAGTTTYYLTDTQNPTDYAQPVEEHQGTVSSTPSRTYLIGDHVFGQAGGNGSVSYLLIDGHGSTEQITNSSGSVTAALAYTAYGTALNFNPAALGGAYFFGGDAVYDAVSGLYMHGDGTRDRIGVRFIQRDTFSGNKQDPLSLHKYIYGQDNPISFRDPSGKFIFSDTPIAILDGLGQEAGDISLMGGVDAFAETVFTEVESADALAGDLATAIG